ncbi:MAG: hypothetical protein CR986_01725 [Ignavibacteriae bacterium]|nr:MAG: hypothetical protein CR986_01725 [Ignavibacteriota bacterium]
MKKEKLIEEIVLLENWITKNGWEGYDPYDIKDIKLVIWITKLGNKNRLAEIFREGLFELFLMFPKFSRVLLRVKPQINAKAMGLFASSYLTLYETEKEEKYLEKSLECIKWLDANFSEKYSGKGWGYPFNWQAQKLIPKFTPNGIVTTAVGDAYWRFYQITKEKKYLNTCIDICTFLSEGLLISNISEEEICFSYTPIFTNYVHNLNLFVAEFLIKTGKEIGNQQWIKIGKKAANYTVASQYTDGSFGYFGPQHKGRNLIDNYHTAFVLRMLYSIYNLTEDEKYLESLKKCYTHYLNNFFENNTIPKFTPERKYRIDIHSCAEAINCLSELSSLFPEGLPIAQNIADWTFRNLLDESGFYYHGIFKSRIINTTFKSKISYIRWNQAWMFKGLTNLYKNLEC